MAAQASSADLRPHVVILTRWRDEFAYYTRYLDHGSHCVSYITTAVASAHMPAEATDVVVVPATDDLASVRDAVHELAYKHGAPRSVIALKEDDLLVGAALREEWDCPGPRQATLMPFRDKYLMCQAVAAAGLPVPAFALYDGRESVLDFAAAAGWPVIVKPRVGSSGEGIMIISDPSQAGLLPAGAQPMLIQEYNASQIYHVDGIFAGGELGPWRASRYTNTCLGFRSGDVLGSAEEDDPRVNAAVRTAAASFLAALTGTATPFHLEMFVDAAGPGPVTCTFLEVGARVGGAEVPFIWRDLHGYDLMAAAFRLQAGNSLESWPEAGHVVGDEVGGWLLIPAPAAPPCRITEVTPMLGRVPGPYAEVLPRPGEVVPLGAAYYEHVGGRFRFRGRSTAEVEAAIAATAADFRVQARPVPSPAAETVPETDDGIAAAAGPDYSQAILSGEGDTDYARYMRTDTLLSLQRAPPAVVHRDELLFQIVHQSTELWLKLACAEVAEACARLRDDDIGAPARLLGRAALSIELITGQLEMLGHLAPWDFQSIRTVLGHGSGFESPGWRQTQRVSADLQLAFGDYLARSGVGLADLYRGSADHPVYRLAEAMIEWDERVSVWRVRHYKIATRVIGHGVVGTKGTPVDTLTRLIAHKFFPDLWQVRTELTQTGPMSELQRPGPR